MEYRSLKTAQAEVRDIDGKPTFVGRAVVYNQWSELLYNYFQERIAPGAFDKCLARGGDIICSIDHDERRLLGRTASSTLKLIPDEQGIQVECPMPNTSYANDLRELIRRGDYRGMSFIFDVITDEWQKIDGATSRTVKEADIYEVSFVIFPAYSSTEVGLRSVGRVEDEAKVRERAYRSLVLPSLDYYERRLRIAERE